MLWECFCLRKQLCLMFVIVCFRYHRLGVLMASKQFKRCVPLCTCFLKEDDTHDLWIICLRVENAQSSLERGGCLLCKHFTMKKLQSCRLSVMIMGVLLLYPRVSEAARRLRLRRSQVELAERSEMWVPFSQTSPASWGVLGMDCDQRTSMTTVLIE